MKQRNKLRLDEVNKDQDLNIPAPVPGSCSITAENVESLNLKLHHDRPSNINITSNQDRKECSAQKSCMKSIEDLAKQKDKSKSNVKWRIGKGSPTSSSATHSINPLLGRSVKCDNVPSFDLLFQDPNVREKMKKQLVLHLPPSGSKKQGGQNFTREGSNHESRFHRR